MIWQQLILLITGSVFVSWENSWYWKGFSLEDKAVSYSVRWSQGHTHRMNDLGLAQELLSPLPRVGIHPCQDHRVLTLFLIFSLSSPDQSIIHCSRQSNRWRASTPCFWLHLALTSCTLCHQADWLRVPQMHHIHRSLQVLSPLSHRSHHVCQINVHRGS